MTLTCKINLTAQVSGQHLCSKYIVPLQIYSQMKTIWISAIYEQDKKVNEKIQYNFLTSKDKNLLGKNSDKWEWYGGHSVKFNLTVPATIVTYKFPCWIFKLDLKLL